MRHSTIRFLSAEIMFAPVFPSPTFWANSETQWSHMAVFLAALCVCCNAWKWRLYSVLHFNSIDLSKCYVMSDENERVLVKIGFCYFLCWRKSSKLCHWQCLTKLRMLISEHSSLQIHLCEPHKQTRWKTWCSLGTCPDCKDAFWSIWWHWWIAGTDSITTVWLKIDLKKIIV